MKIRVFRLQPEPGETNSSDWQRSRYIGGALAYARNEDDARTYADAKFSVPAGPQQGPLKELLVSPWLQPDKVACTEIAHVGGAEPSEGTVIETD